MLRNYRPSHSEECHSPAFAAELRLRAYMEEREISCNKMVRDTGCFIQDIDLARENILSLFVGICGDVACGAGLDAVEAGC